jgi:hypothetical protein
MVLPSDREDDPGILDFRTRNFPGIPEPSHKFHRAEICSRKLIRHDADAVIDSQIVIEISILIPSDIP